MITYLDASAAGKLIMHEPESQALAAYFERTLGEDGVLSSSVLLETELRRMAIRNAIDQRIVTKALDRIDLTGLERDMFTAAGLLHGPRLRALDALHVIAAARTPATVFVSYDARQIEAARGAGLHVISPA